MMYGFCLQHRREHVFRAIMEGIAYGTELVLQSFKENGFTAEELYVAGGAANSDLYLQIHADVSNLPIYVPVVSEAPTLGSAILASVAAGVYKDSSEAIKHMVSFKKKIEPNYENHLRYQEIFNKYREVY